MPLDIARFKQSLLMAAACGWTKPAEATSVGELLSSFLDESHPVYDQEFAERLGAVRPDWLEGRGLSLAGMLHHSVLPYP
jgi:hypothetical protein